MITEVFPIELGGVKYRVAEDMEQPSYVLHRQPLRAPVNGFIQGESGRFQLRPDILEWSMTSWTGGEGFLVYDASSPGRFYISYNVDPFAVPGTLRLAKMFEITQDSTGAADFVLTTSAMATAGDDLILAINNGVYKWDKTNERWGTNIPNATQAAQGRSAVGDSKYFYYSTTDNVIFRFKLSDSTFATFANAPNQVFWLAPSIVRTFLVAAIKDGDNVSVYEYNTSAALPVTGTKIYTVNSGGFDDATIQPKLVAGHNVVYMANSGVLNETVLHRITPTTSAGAGFGEEVMRIQGFLLDGLYYMLGLVYLVGRFKNRSLVLFFDEEALSYGALLNLGEDRVPSQPYENSSSPAWAVAQVGHSGFQTSWVHFSGPSQDDTELTVMLHDGTFEAIAGGAVWNAGAAIGAAELVDGVLNDDIAWFGPDLFISVIFDDTAGVGGSSVGRIIRLREDKYTDATGILESSVNDFDIAEEKILLSIHLDTDPLPAGTSVVVKYQLDQDGTWLTAGTHDTDNASTSTFTISTGAATKSFNNLQLRLELASTVDTVSPIVRRLAVRAAVVRGVRVWDLLLDASDEDAQMQDRSWNGKTLIDNIASAGDSGNVLTFKDGYRSKLQGTPTEYNVVVDEYRVIQDRPGEGYISVKLREVVTT